MCLVGTKCFEESQERDPKVHSLSARARSVISRVERRAHLDRVFLIVYQADQLAADFDANASLVDEIINNSEQLDHPFPHCRTSVLCVWERPYQRDDIYRPIPASILTAILPLILG